jgi:hypothetical protein
MVGHCQGFLCEWDEALARIEEGVRITRRLGLPHGEVFALESIAIIRMQRGEPEPASVGAAAALALARTVGSRRYESILLWILGRIELVEGDREGARAHCAEVRSIMQETGIGGFIGALVCGSEAILAANPTEARRALAEGEDWLTRGSLGHCHFWYRADAIDVALALGDPPLALHHCTELEAYTATEPLPWSDFHVARGRALAAFERSSGAAERAALVALRERAVALGFKQTLPAIDALLGR